MPRAIVAGIRISCAVFLFVLVTYGYAYAVPPLSNGQGISCKSCHTSFPGMTAYGMATMMSSFQNLDWRKQHQALPVAIRIQIESFLSNRDHPGSTVTKTLSIYTAGFLGRNFTYYAEQPILDTGVPGVTEQIWLAWNGLFHGTNSLQVGKYHTPFPFMPAHGWTLSDYLLAKQDNGQNTFEPADSRWGVSFNGMSNEFMYNLAYLAGNGPIQHAFDYNKADGARTLDFNLGYGGMLKPYMIGINLMRGTTPLLDTMGNYVDSDAFTREGLYYSYQTPKLLFQTMYYIGSDNQPDIGLPASQLRGFMFEAQRDIGWRDHILARYDVASSDTFNRQYVLSWAHHFLPNLKVTSELVMSPGSPRELGFAIDWAGPFIQGKRFIWEAPVGATVVPAQAAPPVVAGGTTRGTTTAGGDANAGATLVQNNSCMGCHGAKFQGNIGPKLFGIEHTKSVAQITDAIKHPKGVMPDAGLADSQIADIVAYLSSLDGGLAGGAAGGAPTVSFDPESPSDHATITVRFSGNNPQQVTARAVMQMGAGSHHVDIALHQLANPSVWQGDIHFSMGGPWIVHVLYGDKDMAIALEVGQ